MKQFIVFFIALGLFTNNKALGQENNNPITGINLIQIQQMDLIQSEVIELSKMVINKSIALDSFNQAMLDFNKRLEEMGIQNFQMEIEFSVSGALNSNEFQEVFMPVIQSSPMNIGPSVMRAQNNFLWLTLNQEDWIPNNNNLAPNPKFRIKDWRATVEPGIGNYF